MKRKITALVGILLCAIGLPLTVWADSRTYRPPAKRGTIYVVVDFKDYNSRDFYPKTTVSVKWGSFSRTKKFGTATTIRTAGVVITLRHTKDDSVPLTVETDGRILSIQQSDSPPSQWNSGMYQKDNW
jgi:hypothetical protein